MANIKQLLILVHLPLLLEAVVNNVVEGFEYSAGAYSELALPGATDIEPTGINNSGEIVGTYFPVAVPEPSSLLSLGLGLILVCGIACARRTTH